VSVRVPGTDKCFISPGASTDKTVCGPSTCSSTTSTAPSSSIQAD
jgi:hypothetical protein